MTNNTLTGLPKDLPVPVNDGACDNLVGKKLPGTGLPATNGKTISLSAIEPTLVLYIYPMTGRPDIPLPDGWDSIPGARGCTPQACGFRDHYSELKIMHTEVYGLSTQTTEYQAEARDRLHLPFDLISDSDLVLKKTLSIPTFTVEGIELYKRTTIIARNGIIEKVFYPVFPPDRNAMEVVQWLHENTGT